jgi:hypothetical protein
MQSKLNDSQFGGAEMQKSAKSFKKNKPRESNN